MKFETVTPLLIIALAAVAVGYWLITHFFSDAARWERRRRRSNSPIVSKSKRPSVKFSVNLKGRKKQ